ncbi:MAG: ROK family protein, partial [Atopostipes suicloacalis]|nr:ROK family protein [Atopostipes suicloacalis]
MILMIDIGGTSIKYGLINTETEDYELLGERATETKEKDFRMENRLITIIDSVIGNYVLQGIAISTAGIVNEKEGKIIYANKNIP